MSTKRIVYTKRRYLALVVVALFFCALWPTGGRAESVVVYTRPDGGVSVVSPAPALIVEFLRYGRATGTLTWSGPPRTSPQDVMSLTEAEAAALAFVRGKAVPPDAVDIAVVDRAVLPVSREFRNAWRRAGPGVRVDVPAARAIRATQVRAEIRKRLVKSAEDQAAFDPVTDAARVAAHESYRRQLRAVLTSLTADLATLMTPNALAAWSPVWPADPEGPP